MAQYWETADEFETGETPTGAKLTNILTLTSAELDRTGAAKANLAATTAPTITDDSAAGYGINSKWIDVTADIAYVCLDATAGAAVWQRTSLAAILLSIIALSGNGLIARTAAGTTAARTLTAPAAGITVSAGDGAAGNPTLALANDLAAVEGLSGTGGVERTDTDTWGTYTLTAAGKALLGDADAAAQRATLGLGSPVADGTYNFDATAGKVSSITVVNGIITAITTA